MSAYVGDVLSFYTDKQFKEGLLYYAEEADNIHNFAYTFGYRPKTTTPASVTLDVFQLCPPTGSGTTSRPDYRYGMRIRQGMSIKSNTNTNVYFRTTDEVDFSQSGSGKTEITVYSLRQNGEVDYYLLKKSVKAVAGIIRNDTFSFGQPLKFQKVLGITNLFAHLFLSCKVASFCTSFYSLPFSFLLKKYLSERILP